MAPQPSYGRLVACVLLSGAHAGPEPHRDPSLLRPGLFLYAAPGLPETRFAETVVLDRARPGGFDGPTW